jgi:hypothetical protein
MMTEFGISFLCPRTDWRARDVLAAMEGKREFLGKRGRLGGEKNFRTSWNVLGEVLPSTDVGYAAFVTDDDDLSSALDGLAVVAASSRTMSSSCLREDDLADAVAVANGVAHLSENADHLGLLRRENSLVRKEHLEERCPEEGCPGDPADESE